MFRFVSTTEVKKTAASPGGVSSSVTTTSVAYPTPPSSSHALPASPSTSPTLTSPLSVITGGAAASQVRKDVYEGEHLKLIGLHEYVCEYMCVHVCMCVCVCVHACVCVYFVHTAVHRCM